MSNCWLRLPLELFGNALKNGANAATVAAVANDALFDDSNELALIVTADDDDDDDDPLESDTFESLSAACSLDCSLFVICSLLLLSIMIFSLTNYFKRYEQSFLKKYFLNHLFFLK